MKFIDEAEIDVIAGHGGSGCKHFRREKYIPYGGPDGGNGGRGGSIILAADRGKHTLLDFKYKPHWKAENGKPGEGSRKDGRAGQDLIIKVPVGTQVLNPETDELLYDLPQDGMEVVIAKGGRGGLGNTAFKSPTNRVPEQFQPGEEGEAGTFKLSLKLVADIGLLGLPNAGKSTLISTISAAKPKIADYPFTTLVPNLGVVKYKNDLSFVVADIPGLIPGASQGKGLGIRFLKHIERTAALLHLIDCSQDKSPETLLESYRALREELQEFSADLAKKKELIALTKCELVSDEELKAAKAVFQKEGLEPIAISSAANIGIDQLLDKLVQLLDFNEEF